MRTYLVTGATSWIGKSTAAYFQIILHISADKKSYLMVD